MTQASKSEAENERALIYVVAVMLSSHNAKTMVQCWRTGCTRDEAIGQAFQTAMEAKPGFSIDMHLVTEIARGDHLPSLAAREQEKDNG